MDARASDERVARATFARDHASCTRTDRVSPHGKNRCTSSSFSGMCGVVVSYRSPLRRHRQHRAPRASRRGGGGGRGICARGTERAHNHAAPPPSGGRALVMGRSQTGTDVPLHHGDCAYASGAWLARSPRRGARASHSGSFAFGSAQPRGTGASPAPPASPEPASVARSVQSAVESPTHASVTTTGRGS